MVGTRAGILSAGTGRSPTASPLGLEVELPGVAAGVARHRASVLLALRYHHLVPWREFLPAAPGRPAVLRAGPAQTPLVVPGARATLSWAEVLRLAADVGFGLTALHAAGLRHGAVSTAAVHLDGAARDGRLVARLSGGGLTGLTGPEVAAAQDVLDLGLLTARLLGVVGEPVPGRPPAGLPGEAWQLVLRLVGPARGLPSARQAALALAAAIPTARVTSPQPRPPAELASAAEGPAEPRPFELGDRSYVAPRALPLPPPADAATDAAADVGALSAGTVAAPAAGEAVELELLAPGPPPARWRGPATLVAATALVLLAVLVAVLVVLVLRRGGTRQPGQSASTVASAGSPRSNCSADRGRPARDRAQRALAAASSSSPTTTPPRINGTCSGRSSSRAGRDPAGRSTSAMATPSDPLWRSTSAGPPRVALPVEVLCTGRPSTSTSL